MAGELLAAFAFGAAEAAAVVLLLVARAAERDNARTLRGPR